MGYLPRLVSCTALAKVILVNVPLKGAAIGVRGIRFSEVWSEGDGEGETRE